MQWLPQGVVLCGFRGRRRVWLALLLLAWAGAGVGGCTGPGLEPPGEGRGVNFGNDPPPLGGGGGSAGAAGVSGANAGGGSGGAGGENLDGAGVQDAGAADGGLPALEDDAGTE